jgi:hypothetical protein
LHRQAATDWANAPHAPPTIAIIVYIQIIMAAQPRQEDDDEFATGKSRRERCRAAHAALVACLAAQQQLATDFRSEGSKGAETGPPEGHACRAAWVEFAGRWDGNNHVEGVCPVSWVKHYERARVQGTFRTNMMKLRDEERRSNASLQREKMSQQQ